MQRKHSSIEDVIADMEACAKQYHNGLRLEPQTIGHIFDMFAYELSFYAKQGPLPLRTRNPLPSGVGNPDGLKSN